MSASRLHTTARRFRTELLAREKLTAVEMVRAYQPTHQAIVAQVGAITRRIEEANDAGTPLGRSWLFQQGRAEALEAQIQAEIGRFTPRAEALVIANQRHGVSRGAADSRDLVAAAVGPERAPSILARWDALPRGAVESLIGFSSNGSPLRELFDKLGPQASRAIRDELATGLSLGRNPVKVAKLVRARSGMALGRALTISRTEMLRSYRETTRQSYERSTVVQGWIWLSARQINTCAACWAMDGKAFANDDVMPSHPNCRCSMVPNTGDLEFGNGQDLFDKLPVERQRRILGPTKHDAYRKGEVGLDDFVDTRKSADWGDTVGVGGLEHAREVAKARGALGLAGIRIGQPLLANVDYDDLAKSMQVDLSTLKLKALDSYLSKRSIRANQRLRRGLDLPPDEKKMVQAADEAIAASKLPEAVRTYRGVGSRSMFGASDDLTGVEFEDAAFLSTSIDPMVAARYSDVNSGFREGVAQRTVLAFDLPKGDNAAHVGAVLGRGEEASGELLLARNRRWRIKRTERVVLEDQVVTNVLGQTAKATVDEMRIFVEPA